MLKILINGKEAKIRPFTKAIFIGSILLVAAIAVAGFVVLGGVIGYATM